MQSFSPYQRNVIFIVRYLPLSRPEGAGGVHHGFAAAGFQADWNVAARQNAEGVERHMDRDKMQWSASASLGLQYSLPIGGTDLALYAEPGISHYFDNGSPVQNFFKDKPTSMKLQIGLRFRP